MIEQITIVSLACQAYCYALGEGNILGWWGDLLRRLSRATGPPPWYKAHVLSHLADPLGLCPVCFSFWAALTYFALTLHSLSCLPYALACAGASLVFSKFQ